MVEAKNSVPKHIAVIMDGNGRWARKRMLPRIAGHRAGAKSVRRIVELAVKSNIEVLTLFALSIENRLNRPKREVDLLMRLFVESLERYLDELNDNQVRVMIVGERQGLPAAVLKSIETAELSTRNNSGLRLVIALNYSGRWDILQATKKVLAENVAAETLTEQQLAAHFCLAGLPEPDLLIRTSGESRISNFLLWQLAYTELFFTATLWPDFSANDFSDALEAYASRQRRFGYTSEQCQQDEVHA